MKKKLIAVVVMGIAGLGTIGCESPTVTDNKNKIKYPESTFYDTNKQEGATYYEEGETIYRFN